MTLAHKMFLSTISILGILASIATIAIFGILGLSGDLDRSLDQYKKLDIAYEIKEMLTTSRALLAAGGINDDSVPTILNRACQYYEHLTSSYKTESDMAPYAPRHPRTMLFQVRDRVYRLRAEPLFADVRYQSAAESAPLLDHTLAHIDIVIKDAEKKIKEARTNGNERMEQTLTSVISLSSVLVLVAAVISALQYRNVMMPLRRLREGVETIAKGKWNHRLQTESDREFAQLAEDFNHMSDELQEIYQTLEEKVQAKSKELVRSERLASVGFLAAGVAHEINNPLGIMSGYAELSIKQLEKLMDQAWQGVEVAANASEVDEAADLAARSAEKIDQSCRATMDKMKIVIDEAQRCKKITAKLLSLARSEPESRNPVALPMVAINVSELIRGLPRFRGREVTVKLNSELVSPAEALTESDKEPRAYDVLANEAQLQQVLLNLTINALEAMQEAGIETDQGIVSIDVSAIENAVVITVEDNGKGMTAETLEHIFEPFYTEKKVATDGESGTGLGLAITYTIVEDHDGRIVAESEGLGKGSRFVIFLPAYHAGTPPLAEL